MLRMEFRLQQGQRCDERLFHCLDEELYRRCPLYVSVLHFRKLLFHHFGDRPMV